MKNQTRHRTCRPETMRKAAWYPAGSYWPGKRGAQRLITAPMAHCRVNPPRKTSKLMPVVTRPERPGGKLKVNTV